MMTIPLRHYTHATIGCENKNVHPETCEIMNITNTETRVNNVRYYELTCPKCFRKVTLELERNS